MNWNVIRVWAAILLLLDGAFGLWNHQKVEEVAPKLNIPRIALFEALAALVLILIGLL
ncbi:MAG: hypothetical protein PHP93_00200 [Kiritimatiellales bacterium]|nr:hypothetical protein [Kiritimatiellales bacterium]